MRIRTARARFEQPPANAIVWLFALAVGLVGDQIYFISLTWVTISIASSSEVGLVLAAGSLPRAFLLLGGGVLTDSLGAKRTAFLGLTGRICVLIVGSLLIVSRGGSLPILIALAAGFGVFDAIFLPSVSAMPPLLVSSKNLTRLQAARSLTQRGSTVIGAPLAGFLVTWLGAPMAFAINVPFAIAAALLLAVVKTRRETAVVPPTPKRASRQIIEGIRYVSSRRDLVLLLLIVAISDFGLVGPINTGLPLLAEQSRWGPEGVGVVLGAFGTGAASAAGFIVVKRGFRHSLRIARIALIAGGVSLAGIGWSPDLAVACVCAFVLGVGSSLCGTLLTTAVVRSTPLAHMGRVMSMLSLASYGFLPLSYMLTGLAAAWSPIAPFAFGALIVLAASAVHLREPPSGGPPMPSSEVIEDLGAGRRGRRSAIRTGTQAGEQYGGRPAATLADMDSARPVGSSVLTDTGAMRALAHPTRLKLLSELRRNGPQTVGMLAAALGIAVGSASYHLKTLEAFDFIEPAPDKSSDRREKWFRASHSQTDVPRLRSSEHSRDDTDAYDQLRRAIFRRYLDILEEYLEAEHELDDRWVQNAVNSDVEFHLTSGELGELRNELDELVARWSQPQRSNPVDDIEPVTFIYHAFRRP